jgi:hypothetical protein
VKLFSICEPTGCLVPLTHEKKFISDAKHMYIGLKTAYEYSYKKYQKKTPSMQENTLSMSNSNIRQNRLVKA